LILAVFSKSKLIFRSRQYKFIVFAVLTAVFSLSIAQTAEGGILSSLVGFLTASVGQTSVAFKPEGNQQTETNSQNIDLLESVTDTLATSSSFSEIDEITSGNAVLSETGPMGTVADIKDDQSSSDLISVYTVRQGDTLGEIAEMYNVSVNTVRWANNLKKGEFIKPGDILVILPVTGIQLTIKKGDTIGSLAKKYGGDVDEIIAYNNLESAKPLVAGSTILVPNGEESVIISPTQSAQKLPSKYQGPSYPGYFMCPVTNYRRTQGLHGNNAVDLAAPLGTPIYAAADGKVIIARDDGWNGGYGNYVVIAHSNDTQTLYAHLSRLNVSVGNRVGRGDTIGAMGSTGNSTGSHIHFEVRGAVNPF